MEKKRAIWILKLSNDYNAGDPRADESLQTRTASHFLS